MFSSVPRLLALSGLFIVAAAFIPGKARAQSASHEANVVSVDVGAGTVIHGIEGNAAGRACQDF